MKRFTRTTRQQETLNDERQPPAAGVLNVNARWQAAMAGFFVDSDGAPDKRFLELTEVLHLEDQLAGLDAAPAPAS